MALSIDPTVCLKAITGFLNVSGNVTHSQLYQYQQYLMSLRDHPMYATVLFEILGLNRIVDNSVDEDGIRMFCLTALHDWTKKWWSEMNSAQHLELRNSISNIIVSSISEEASTSYCNKCASLIVEIAERQFPDQWTSFVDDLLALWVRGSFNKQQTTLKTLHDLYTDCTDPDFTGQLSTTRRQEIISALQPYHTQVIGLINEFFSNHLQQYLSNKSNPNYPDSALHIRSISLALQLLSEMAAVIPLEDWLLCPHNTTDFLTIFFFALQVPELQLLVVTILEKFCRHEISKEPVDSTISMMLSFFTRDTSNGINIFTTPTVDDEEDQIKFLSLMPSVLTGFIQSNWTNLQRLCTTSSVVVGQLQVMFQYVLTVVSNPLSIKSASESIMDIQKIFHAGKLYKSRFLIDGAAGLLSVYFDRAKRVLFIDHPDLEEEAPWFSVEFEEDREDYIEFFGTYLSKCQLLIIAMVREVPLPTVVFLQERLLQVMEMASSLFATPVGQTVTRQQQRWLAKQIEKHAHILCRALQVTCDELVQQMLALSESTAEGNAPMKKGKGQQMASNALSADEQQILQYQREHKENIQRAMQLALQLISSVLNWTIPSFTAGVSTNDCICLVQKEQLRLLGAGASLFTLPSFTRAMLPQILEKLFQYVFVSQSSAAQGATKDEHDLLLSVSDLAANTIASFLHRCAKYIEDMTLFDMILQTSSQLLTSNSAQLVTSEATKMAMRETLIVVSNFLPNTNPLKAQLITSATQDIMKRLSDTQSQMLSSVDQFVLVNRELMGSGQITSERELLQKLTELLSPLRDGFVAFVQVTRKIDISSLDYQVFRLYYESLTTATEATNAAVTSSATTGAPNVNNSNTQTHSIFLKQLHKQYSLMFDSTASSSSPVIASSVSQLADTNQVLRMFPLAQGWFQILESLRAILPVLVQLSLSTTTHPAALANPQLGQYVPPCVQQACHQNALSDICRLMGKKYQSAHLQGWELHELWRNLWINLWKVMDMACRQRVFYLWPSHTEFLHQELLPVCLANIPSHHLGRLLRYFLSGYILNVLPTEVIPGPAGNASPLIPMHNTFGTFIISLLEIMDQRLQSLWTAVNTGDIQALSAVDDDGLSSLQPSRATNDTEILIPTTADSLQTFREYRIRELMTQYADLLAEMVGLKGPLGIDSSISANSSAQSLSTASTNPTSLSSEEKKTSRREGLRYILFSLPLPQASSAATGLATAGQRFCATLNWLLRIPDVNVFKTTLSIVQYLVEEIQRSYHDVQVYESIWRYYEPFVMGEAFMSVLRVLLMQENWSMGIGWDMVDYLLLILRMYVLVLPLDVPTTGNVTNQSNANNAGGKKGNKNQSDVSASQPAAATAVPRHRSDVPLEQFVSTALVNHTEIDHLLKELARGNAKKRQRAIVKDFISLVMISKIHDASQLKLQGSELVNHAPKVNTTASDEIAKKKTKAKKAASIAASIFASLAAQDAQEDLTAGLFDDL